MKLTVFISRRKSAVAVVLILLMIASAATSAHSGKPPQTATPIKHVIVIFDENRSFDHYFGVYPNAANPPGEPPFTARPDTPQVAGLSGSLLTDNPNLANPFRFDRSQAKTCDQNHGYSSEQLAFDSGLMDKFVQFTGTQEPGCDPTSVMGYFDGNTVTALWNYAQHFAISDNLNGSRSRPKGRPYRRPSPEAQTPTAGTNCQNAHQGQKDRG